eukprot:gene26455-biopygen16526
MPIPRSSIPAGFQSRAPMISTDITTAHGASWAVARAMNRRIRLLSS